MLQKLAIFKYIINFATHLKWGLNFLLYQSFNFSHKIDFPVDIFAAEIGATRHHEHSNEGSHEEEVECSICLCKIEKGEEVKELSCDHLFHRVCLDRWVGDGNMTCPLCRNYLRLPPFAAELHQELIVFKFCSFGSRERESWWLR